MNTIQQRPVPRPFEQYHHFKGKDYQIITLATDEEDGQELVIYQALYGDHKIWARHLDSFLAEVDHIKYPEASQKYRFVLAGEDAKKDPAITGDPAQNQSQVNAGDGDIAGMDSRILAFLDAQSSRDKLDILASLHADITDDMIDTLAVACGLEIAKGSIETRYHDLRDCLLTISRYELDGNRLR